MVYDAYEHVMMYALRCFLAGENKSRAVGEQKKFCSLRITTEDELRINWRENNSDGE